MEIKKKELKEIIDLIFEIKEKTEYSISMNYTQAINWVDFSIVKSEKDYFITKGSFIWGRYHLNFEETKRKLKELLKGDEAN